MTTRKRLADVTDDDLKNATDIIVIDPARNYSETIYIQPFAAEILPPGRAATPIIERELEIEVDSADPSQIQGLKERLPRDE